jgi:hypothetical protein
MYGEIGETAYIRNSVDKRISKFVEWKTEKDILILYCGKGCRWCKRGQVAIENLPLFHFGAVSAN